jgi:hypothetical protein
MFVSERTTIHLWWHKDGERENKDVMVHPSDSDAWKALDNIDPEFAQDVRNVRIGLATDGFTPFGDNAISYSCWPMFVVPYNLPPSLCMKYEFMFLCLIVPGLDHHGPQLNVMLRPLINELKELCNGVEAYDSYKKQKFTLWAAYLWSIHDFKAYGTFPGWSVHGRLTSPICGSNTDCFHLTTGGKIGYFDYHRRWLPPKHTFRMQNNSFSKDTVVKKGPPKHLSWPKIVESHSKLVLNEEWNGYEGYGEEHNWTHICALWVLPYAQALILMHNIGVMHQECNVAESIISMCLNIMGKTKDNFKAQIYIAEIYNRPPLELDERRGKQHAPFCL